MRNIRSLAYVAAAVIVGSPHQGSGAPGVPIVVPLTETSGLTPIGVTVAAVTYRGRRAVRLTPARSSQRDPASGGVALVDHADFAAGTIELHVAGTPVSGADTSVRGFVGVTFHTSTDAARFENIYLRATNGRADDQLRRNHAVQYQSVPDHAWFKLRHDSPGQYEAYTDLTAGAWTTMRIVVTGTRALLFVDRAAQPCLIVNDLKLGEGGGGIGLWIGPGTVAYFSHLTVTPAASR